MDTEKVSKINWLGFVSLLLSALIILIFLGTLIILVVASSIARCFGCNYSFVVVFSLLDNAFEFPLLALPLGLLNIIVAIFARKYGSVRQKKVAANGITLGILGILLSLGSFFHLFLDLIIGS